MKRFFLISLSSIFLCSGLLSGCTPADTQTEEPESYDTQWVFRTAPSVEAEEAVAGTAEQFTVSRVFSHDMVIQRDEFIRIWGWAPDSENGKIVSASFKGLNGHAVIENGEWMITLGGTLQASTEMGHSLVISGNHTQVTFEDVLVGDVYWVAGQSNAVYTLSEAMASAPDSDPIKNIEITDEEPIRLYRNSWDTGDVKGVDLCRDVNHKRGWQLPKKGARGMSALGYCFAKQLVEQTDGHIPIGIVSFTGSAMPLSAFLPSEVAEACGADAWNEQSQCYYAPDFVGSEGQKSRRMYNQLVYPFQNFPMTAMLWYQGESDLNEASRTVYVEQFTAMIREYRNRLNQHFHDFPVLIVELPSIYSNESVTSFMDFGIIRSIMGGIPAALEQSYLLSSSDVWKDETFPNNLHPYCKWPQAQRAVRLVLPMFYGGETAISYAEGPTAISFTYSNKNKTVSIGYRSVGDGLKYKEEEIKGFQILVEGTWKDAQQVSLVGKNTVRVQSDAPIEGVRYHALASTSFPETLTLCNSSDIPAAACFHQRTAP